MAIQGMALLFAFYYTRASQRGHTSIKKIIHYGQISHLRPWQPRRQGMDVHHKLPCLWSGL